MAAITAGGDVTLGRVESIENVALAANGRMVLRGCRSVSRGEASASHEG